MNLFDFSNNFNEFSLSLSKCNLNIDYFNSSILNVLDIYSPIRSFF